VGTPAAVSPNADRELDRAAGGLQALVDRYKNEGGGRTVVGALPVRVAFPAFGPSLFLASELTAEATAPRVDLVLKRVK